MSSNGALHKANWPQVNASVELFLLDGGSFIGDLSKVHAGASGNFRMYNWAFCISHQGRHVLWDLGLDEVCVIISLVFFSMCSFQDYRIVPIIRLGSIGSC